MKVTVGKCDYDCKGKEHGKGRGLGYRVHCRKVDKKCTQNGKPQAKTPKPKKRKTIMQKRIERAAHEVEMELRNAPDGMTDKELEETINYRLMAKPAKAAGMTVRQFKSALLNNRVPAIDLVYDNEIMFGLADLIAIEAVVVFFDNRKRIYLHTSQQESREFKTTPMKVMEMMHIVGKPIRAIDLSKSFNVSSGLRKTDVEKSLKMWVKRGDIVKSTDTHPFYSIKR